jgi:hypothetical protein
LASKGDGGKSYHGATVRLALDFSFGFWDNVGVLSVFAL